VSNERTNVSHRRRSGATSPTSQRTNEPKTSDETIPPPVGATLWVRPRGLHPAVTDDDARRAQQARRDGLTTTHDSRGRRISTPAPPELDWADPTTWGGWIAWRCFECGRAIAPEESAWLYRNPDSTVPWSPAAWHGDTANESWLNARGHHRQDEWTAIHTGCRPDRPDLARVPIASGRFHDQVVQARELLTKGTNLSARDAYRVRAAGTAHTGDRRTP
jgi:hypothetical protein